MAMVLNRTIFFSAALNGKMTGQLNTAKAAYSILKAKYNTYLFNRNIINFIVPIFYIPHLAMMKILRKKIIFYITYRIY